MMKCLGSVNMPISEEKFDRIYAKMRAYLQGRDLYVFDGFAGADKTYRQQIRVVNELASQNLFIHQLLIRPSDKDGIENHKPDFTIIAVPGFKCIPKGRRKFRLR